MQVTIAIFDENYKEAQARWTCCQMCKKNQCEREADDCDVKIYLENKTESEW